MANKSDIENTTYLVPKLRHLRWAGTNFRPEVAACNRKEPDEALAGDKLSEAIPATVS